MGRRGSGLNTVVEVGQGGVPRSPSWARGRGQKGNLQGRDQGEKSGPRKPGIEKRK